MKQENKEFAYFFNNSKGEYKVKEKIITNNLDVPMEGQYRAFFRCTNCGTVFEHDMRKGTLAKEMGGNCPYCGVRSGSPGVGVFPTVKYNPMYDEINKRYYS
jgi:rubrerythrin